METGKLTIIRTKQSANRLRKLQLFIDGEKLYQISSGETKTFELPVGEHQMYAKIDWCQTKPITVNISSNKELTFELGSPLKQNLIFLMLAIILFAFVITGRRFLDESTYTILLFTSLALYIVIQLFVFKEKPVLYYITFGRDKFLYLKEI